MKIINTLIAITLLSIILQGCAAGSATAGYAMRAGTADELKPAAREAIIKEAIERCRGQR